MKKTLLVLAAALALVVAPMGLGAPDGAPRAPVQIQILSISDWHAQLDPISGVGGASVLSSYFKAERAANPNTLTFTAGDAYGASPPLSGFFDEVPAVRAMNLMGFTADTFGNHNFDRGLTHLQQMIDLAEFDYVSANLRNMEDELDGPAPWRVYTVGGVKVGVVGITNPEAPSLVFPGNFGSIAPTDPVPAANKARAAAKKAGAQVVVAITHLGITGTDLVTGERTGPLVDFAENVGGFDVIFGDHTDVQYQSVINNALVVENRSKGQTYSRTTLSVDSGNGRTISRTNAFVQPLVSAVVKDQAIEDMLRPYRDELAEKFDRVIGETTGVFVRGSNIERVQEVALGNLVTDSMRWRYGTQLALTNGGGLRASMPSSYVSRDTTLTRSGCSATTPCDIVLGDPFTVLPFGNIVVTRTVTGSQLWSVLEHGVAAMPSANGRFPQISGFRFTYTTANAPGSRVLSVELPDGTPIARDATTYSFATNDFTNSGGDGYTMLADGQGTSREVMADVLAAYIEDIFTLTPTTEGRITRVG
ncbi:MAG TPA: 5'-nucleotidase C-terminal domain-containing protein [Gaiellaceae bacterium]|nr:5'-nucleotidase C-terminal domain-containing protein [Gaiellaceae bacterium]